MALVDEHDRGVISAELFQSAAGVFANPQAGQYLAGGFECHVLVRKIKASHASRTDSLALCSAFKRPFVGYPDMDATAEPSGLDVICWPYWHRFVIASPTLLLIGRTASNGARSASPVRWMPNNLWPTGIETLERG